MQLLLTVTYWAILNEETAFQVSNLLLKNAVLYCSISTVGMLSLMPARMLLSGAFTLIGPYSWHLFTERISWVKALFEPKENAGCPHWRRFSSPGVGVGVGVGVGGGGRMFHCDLQCRSTPPEWSAWVPGCWLQGALALLWKFQVPDTRHHTHLWTDLPLPTNLFNKPQYLKNISKNYI